MIETTTHILRDDEPCFGMSVREEDDGFVTRLVILRGDDLQTCTIKHGPSAFSGMIPPMFVPSPEGENPVGLMLEMSEHHRSDLRYWKYAEELRESSTLIKDVIEQEEKALLQVRNASVLGPHVTVQRHGHSHEKVQRDWMDTRAARTGKRSFPT